MKGFLIASGLLLVNLFACGASFFSQNTALLLVAFLMLFPLIWAHGFVSGKSVEIQSPVKAKHAPTVTMPAAASVQRPRPVDRLRKLSSDEQI